MLVREQPNLPNLSEPSGKSKILINFSGSVLRSIWKLANVSLKPCAVANSLSSVSASEAAAPGGATLANKLFVETDDVRPSQRWFIASAAVIRSANGRRSSAGCQHNVPRQQGSLDHWGSEREMAKSSVAEGRTRVRVGRGSI